jgi:hypothetical protein
MVREECVMIDDGTGDQVNWRGFIVESMSWMNYDNMTLSGKLWFWLQIPRKAFLFYVVYPLVDAFVSLINRIKE